LFDSVFSIFSDWFWLFLTITCLGNLPIVAAVDFKTPFPSIPFAAFSTFIQATFSSEISLATVLVVLFSMLDNPELLNLHACQKHPSQNEKKICATAWIKALSRALGDGLEVNRSVFWKKTDYIPKDWTGSLALKLDDLAELLHLSSYDKNGHFQKELKTVSQSDIEPIRFICPISMSCTTKGCNAAHLSLATRERDIPKVTLIKGSSIFTRVFALTGECAKCHTLYTADHESYVIPDQRRREVFLNMAPYLKVGTNIWVDRVFSNAVINGVYSFHASTNAYVEYWNQSFGSLYATNV